MVEEDVTVKTDNLQRFLFDEIAVTDEEDELAFYINRFNLDAETIEIMPALGKHIRSLLSETKENCITNIEDEVAFFMNRFNLDIDTMICMPAFEEHLRKVFED